MRNIKFIGRDKELNQLKQLIEQASHGHGSIIFLEGEYGIGKTSLLDELKQRIQNDQQLEKAKFVLVSCDPSRDIAENSAYQPFKDILYELWKEEEMHNRENTNKKQTLNKVLEIIKEVASEWLPVVPVAGPLVNATAKTAISVASKLSEPSNISDYSLSIQSNVGSKAELMYDQYANAVTRIAKEYNVLVMVIEQAELIDSSSCTLLLRLSRTIKNLQIAFITAYRPESINRQLNEVILETQKRDVAYEIRLNGWEEDEIHKYLQLRYGGSLHPNLAAWLRELCNGRPLFVKTYLDLLKEAEIIQITDEQGIAGGKEKEYKLNGDIRHEFGEWKFEGALKTELPGPGQTIERFINERIIALLRDEEDKKYLQIASVQGSRFMSIILMHILQKEEIDINNKLRDFEKNLRIIKYYRSQDWSRVGIDVFAFELLLLQQILYSDLRDSEKMRYHKDIAKILESITKDKVNPLRQLTLEIARHYQLGGESALAAKYYFEAAQSSFREGALKETERICQRALENIRAIPEDKLDSLKLRAEIIQVLLSASEMWWQGKSKQGTPFSKEEKLVEEAESAALQIGDLSLLVRIKYLKGKIYITTRDLDSAIEALEEALHIAQDIQDPLAEFFVTAELGYRIIGSISDKIENSFDRGLELQYSAYKLFESRLKSKIKPDLVTDMNRQLYQLKARIGIGEFDRGNYGEAIKWLLESITGLKEQKRIEELAWSLNFLGQVYTAIGLFEDAEKVLQEAINLHKDEKDPIAIRGYNLALLGKLYIEWGRVKDAADLLINGWSETCQANMVAIVPLIRNYFSELLMHQDYKEQNLSMAESLLRTSVQEAEMTKFYRNKIIALWLLGKLGLMQSNIDSAIKNTMEAVRYLEEKGIMPPIRIEEVYFDSYRILRMRSDYKTEANYYLNKAYTILQNKANSLKNEDYKRTFLNRVPISREILSNISV